MKWLREDYSLFAVIWFLVGCLIVRYIPQLWHVTLGGFAIVFPAFWLLHYGAGYFIWQRMKRIKTNTEKKIEAFLRIIDAEMRKAESDSKISEEGADQKVFNAGLYDGLRHVSFQINRNDRPIASRIKILCRDRQGEDIIEGLYFSLSMFEGSQSGGNFMVPVDADKPKFIEGVKTAYTFGCNQLNQVFGKEMIDKWLAEPELDKNQLLKKGYIKLPYS